MQSVGFFQAIKLFYKRTFDFQGRSPRSEYWWAILYQLILFFLVIFVLGAIVGIVMGVQGESTVAIEDAGENVGIIALAVLVLIHLISNIALAVRRFHDLDQTGWLVLVFNIAGNIPLIGLLVFAGQLIWYAMPGTVGANQYGPDPLRGDQADIFS
jgi:uncharacterized membrane protein YhaH (DUF805 family)